MSNELIAKAMSGDPESQFKLGKAYAQGTDGFEKNPAEAVKWLDKISDEYKGPLEVMIGIGLENQDPDLVLKSFRKLVEVHNAISYRVTLGAILCGDPNNRHINPEVGGIPELAEPPYYNPKEGFRLIEEGVRLAESAEKNPLGCRHYEEIHAAYHYHTGKRKEYFQNGHCSLTEALSKKAEYVEKVLAALKARKGTSHIPEEKIPVYIALWEKM